MLIAKDGFVIPIEIKSGNTRAMSLNNIVENKNIPVVYYLYWCEFYEKQQRNP